MAVYSYYSDYVITLINNIGNLVYKIIIFWYAFLIGYPFIMNNLLIHSLLTDFYNHLVHFILNLKDNLLIALIFLPFYYPIIVGIFKFFLLKYRKFYFRYKPLNDIKLVKIIDMYCTQGGGEADWTDYFLFVRHPTSQKKMQFKVADTVYTSYQMGDEVSVNYHPEVKSILILNIEVKG